MKIGMVVLALAMASGCARGGQGVASNRAGSSPGVAVAGGNAPGVTPAAAGAAPVIAPRELATALDHGVVAPKAFDNLTVFAITSKSQEDIGPIMTLDDALAKHTAEVREIGASARGGRDARQSAEVNSLVIENKGTVPVYVLAGTIVKGGNQDRQIGADFIIGAKQTTPVDAFCVEHGRWTADRQGVQTAGQFGTIGLLAESHVRAAGQYKKDQGEVWSKVGEVNAANRKEAASGTLMATLDDGDIVGKRLALAGKVNAYLDSIQPNDPVVGLAFAIDGNVRGVRWFANHKVFELYKATLVNTAAVDAITAQAAAVASGRPVAPAPAVTPQAVISFVDGVQSAQLKEASDTKAENVNEYRESAGAYGSSTMMKPGAGSPPAAKPKKVSSDFISK